MTIFTAERLAEMCGCTVATINRKTTEIGGRKVGRGWVFSEERVKQNRRDRHLTFTAATLSRGFSSIQEDRTACYVDIFLF